MSAAVKRCNGCGKEYPATLEHWSYVHKNWLASRCKECRAEQARRWYARRGRAQRQAHKPVAMAFAQWQRGL